MFIYSNSTGNHKCEGLADMRKADGFATNYAPRIVFDEEGALVGLQGGELSLQKSMPMIKALRDEQLMMKAKPVVMRKSVAPSRSILQSRQLHKSLSDNLDKFSQLHREMDAIKRMQRV